LSGFTNNFWWLFNGTNILQTGTNLASGASLTTPIFTNDLVLTNFDPQQAGDYTFLLSNRIVATGSVLGAPAAFTATVQPADSNGDGLPDWWVLANGLDPMAPIAQQDPDHDGLSNLQEYLAGTDPRDSRGCLLIEAAGALAGGAIILQFQAVSNRAYVIECHPFITDASWQKLQAFDAAPTNRTLRLTNALPGPVERYYRLAIPNSP
jgi:hypothetical protein